MSVDCADIGPSNVSVWKNLNPLRFRLQNLAYAGMLQGVDGIQMEELIAVKGER